MEVQLPSKVHDQKTILPGLIREETQDECLVRKDSTVDPVILLGKPSKLSAQSQQIGMHQHCLPIAIIVA
jgi:hypothetical protein